VLVFSKLSVPPQWRKLGAKQNCKGREALKYTSVGKIGYKAATPDETWSCVHQLPVNINVEWEEIINILVGGGALSRLFVKGGEESKYGMMKTTRKNRA
jgi:hypothetical protein